MRLSISFSNRAAIILVATLLCLSGCATADEGRQPASLPRERGVRVAVLPVHNLSGSAAPVKEIRKALLNRLQGVELQVIDDNLLEKFMARHRIRYTGGVDTKTALALKAELKVDAVVITSLETYREIYPAKVSLTSRLVSTGEKATIEWMESVGVAGDDSPGLLGLGLVHDHSVVRDKALSRLAESLGNWLAVKRKTCSAERAERRFRPKGFYSTAPIDPGVNATVAVLPFFNLSTRKHASEITLLHFVRQLACAGNIEVVEPGIIREKMLNMRIIMEDGVSVRDADLIANNLNADYILSGKVFDYQDYGIPKIDFSAILMERMSKKVVWASKSYSAGDDGVFFFDMGQLNSATVLASKMVQAIVTKMIGGK